MDDAHHRLRRSPARGSRPARLVGLDQDHAAQLDRSLGGRRSPFRGRCCQRRRSLGDHDRRLHDPPRHPLRRHLHGAGTRASAGRHPGRRRLRRRRQPGVDGRRRHPGRSRCGLPRSRRADDRRRPSGEQGEDGRLSGCPRDEPGQRRVDPGVHRRLCPDGLRHRRHHGRACPGRTRLGLRDGVRPADHSYGATARRLRRRRPRRRCLRRRWSGRELLVPRRSGRRGRQGRDHRVARSQRLRRRDGHHEVARLAVRPSALLGGADPDRLRRRRQPDLDP